MVYLTGVTLLWAFSYSLIGVYLSGQVDSYFAVLMRIALAGLVFLPLLRPRSISWRARLGLMGIGAIQLGIMYLFFYQSFLLLSVPEVLLFTIFTPVYITLIDDSIARRFSPRYLGVAVLAVTGAAVIRYDGITADFWLGFLVVQGANIAFAFGQVGYRHLSTRLPGDIAHRHLFGWFYLGALCVALPAFWLLGDATQLPTQAIQWVVLAWLGIVASGLGYFLWNTGACRVDAGTLAVMNNVLIPAGLLVNLVIWNRDADLVRLALGAMILGASLWLNARWARRRKTTHLEPIDAGASAASSTATRS
ncbi:DMT family transporter [Salinicola aestuarinus]|uniref:DMT family transporter n=1 Tax=Salinicola aestuarinus TaxID=1949082 RepID=UPI001FD8AD42|nr:DMT family transporter [Salinicola aestuarinus]